MIVDILGTEYEIVNQNELENKKLETANGICEIYARKIILNNIQPDDATFENLDAFKRRTLRHEIIHAFLAESGLRTQCDWAESEEMVDWFAIQIHKLMKVFIEAGAVKDGD